MMDRCVVDYLAREADRQVKRDLRKTAEQLRKQQDETRPIIEKARKARWARRRQDGPRGFIMVEPTF